MGRFGGGERWDVGWGWGCDVHGCLVLMVVGVSYLSVVVAGWDGTFVFRLEMLRNFLIEIQYIVDYFK